jgi:hypothetical protein
MYSLYIVVPLFQDPIAVSAIQSIHTYTCASVYLLYYCTPCTRYECIFKQGLLAPAPKIYTTYTLVYNVSPQLPQYGPLKSCLARHAARACLVQAIDFTGSFRCRVFKIAYSDSAARYGRQYPLRSILSYHHPLLDVLFTLKRTNVQ